MRILIAEDDPIARHVTRVALDKWGFEVLEAEDGEQAWALLQAENPPAISILDWQMPGMDGVELCKKIRNTLVMQSMYIIMLTSKGEKENLIEGLESGADDYLIKPFDPGQLRARLHVGERIVRLQQSLADRVNELEAALTNLKQLRGLLPICSYCKKIRNDDNYWQQLESYLCEHTDAQFSHGICPDCYQNIVQKELNEFKAQMRKNKDPQ